MVQAKLKRTALALLSLSVFLLGSAINVFAFSSDWLDYKLEESIKEIEETDLFEKILFDTGSNDSGIANEYWPFSQQIKAKSDHSLYFKGPIRAVSSLIILYCCMKVPLFSS